MTNNQRQLALAVLGSLLIARFVFVPWQTAQDDLNQQMQISAKRLDKAERLADIETQVREQTTQLQARQQDLLQTLPAVPSSEQSAQVLQQLLQSHFEAAGVTVALFNWQGIQPYSDKTVQRGRASLRLSAPVSALVRSLSSLQQRYPYLMLSEWISAEVPADQMQVYEIFITIDLLVKVEPA